MKQLKKHSIGFNTVSSKNGIISGRGVKSKPNNLQIYGYTYEIGEGEKSTDNPYKLVSLDNGNVNLYSEDKIKINTVGRLTSTGKKVYGIELPSPTSGYYRVQAEPSTEYPLTYNFYNVETNELIENNWNIAINSNYSSRGTTIKVKDGLGLLLYDCRDNSKSSFTNRTNLMIIDANVGLIDYISDTHSIKLTNNDKIIQVPVPIPLNSVEGVSDYIYKDTNRIWKLKQNNNTINSYNDEDISTSYISSTNDLSAGATVIYQLDNQITHILSDYAQDLLNSFTLQNHNEIYIEGYPEILISGYIQKEGNKKWNY